MRLALISDIHGNLPALEAIWEDIRKNGIDKIYNLGDSLYGPLWPEETARFLIGQSVESLLGNGDEDLITKEVKNTNLEYTYRELSPKSIEWLHALRPSITWDEWTLFHASPGNLTDYLLEKIENGTVRIKSVKEIRGCIQHISTRFIACGHSHVARIVSCEEQVMINAGSVGLPAYRDDDPPHAMETFSPMATYVAVDDTTITIRKIPYDYEKSAKRALKNDRPDWHDWLMTGRVNQIDSE